MKRRLVWVAVGISTGLLSAAVWSALAIAGNGAPEVPHGVAGNERCLVCHNASSPKPLPASHAAFDEGMCMICHTAAARPTPAAGGCMECHSQPGFSMTLADGETLLLYVDPDIFASSVHSGVQCTDCHASITGYPHPPTDTTGRRQYTVAQSNVCKKCHFDEYTKTVDSIHYSMLASGNLESPLCSDCHGAHDVTRPSEPRTRLVDTCATCHQDVYQSYAASVHGKPLLDNGNTDVPACTDCHRSHTIEDPRTAAFRLRSVELCTGCHGNEQLMQKYGLSTSVVKTYLQDFHGRTVTLAGKQGKDAWVEEAVCADCHGVHDIQEVDSPDSPVVKANLVETCRKCHANATENFPSAWLSHYEPSIQKASLVFFARWFYTLLIPFILVGISIHVVLDLWRTVRERKHQR